MSRAPKIFHGSDRRTRAAQRTIAAVAALLLAGVVLSGCGPVVFLWGSGFNGQGEIGDSTTVSRTIPAAIDLPLTRLSAGLDFTVGVRTDGTLWTWGNNGFGQLGDGTTTSRTTPRQIGTATNCRSVSAGQSHAVATRTDGTLWARGFNGQGELGDGTNLSRFIPVQIGTDTNWNTVTAGTFHTVARPVTPLIEQSRPPSREWRT